MLLHSETYVSFQDIFTPYEMEDRIVKYTDIVASMALRLKMPEQTLMRPDTYGAKLLKYLESDVSLIYCA